MSNIGFLETMLQYYLPGLEVSSLDDDEFANKIGWLFQIRQMEKVDQISSVIKNLIQ
jgi:hypothetical protein